MTLDSIRTLTATRGLAVLGAFHPDSGGTRILLGPDEPHFWAIFTNSAAYNDGRDDPLDRWSKTVITELARELDAEASYPSDGPPYPPFIEWALKCANISSAPVSLLVHDEAGLFVSFRGALTLPRKIAVPQAKPSPCETCVEKPCLSACPVAALTGTSYDVPTCHAYLNTADGTACLSGGCLVRRACPVGINRRIPAQSAFHMRAFHKG